MRPSLQRLQRRTLFSKKDVKKEEVVHQQRLEVISALVALLVALDTSDPVEFASGVRGVAQQVTNILYKIGGIVDKHPHALIPEVHKVYEAAKRKAAFYEVPPHGRGTFGHRIVKNTHENRKEVKINIDLRTCEGHGDDCIRPAISKELCCHLIRGLADAKRTESPSFFPDNYPRYYLTSEVRKLIRDASMAFTPPNTDSCPISATESVEPPQFLPPPPKRGRHSSNVTRFPSDGEKEV